ncbi:phosphoserine phosphatase SerB [Marinibaculum pumilum]|uniref:Phosphoserine phosphatase n=1 Tax=Marinibaculum pumilum TaxID=1766165 RepID=A0ABV7LAV1_9PROT
MSHVLILISAPDDPAVDDSLLARIADAAGADATQAQILAPGKAAELPLKSGVDAAGAARAAAEAHAGLPVDSVVLPAANRRKRLLLADMDSTMIQQECIDELADRLGRKADVAAITEKTMRGDIDFPTALRSRAAMVAGLPASIIDEVFDSAITFTPGGATMIATLRQAGIYTALVSGGFTDFTSRVRGRLGFDEDRANRLVIDDGGRLTGGVHDPILDSSAKRTALDELAGRLGIGPADAAALGDGANDCDMIAHAGLGIGYRPKPKLAAVADAILHHADLTGVLYLMGFREAEFAAA